MSITITWHGHSCFSVSADGYSIVLDPYAPDSVPGLPPLSLSASQVLCSHGHSDHGYTDAVDLSARKQGSPFTVTVIQTFHDDQNGSLRGKTGSISWKQTVSGSPIWATWGVLWSPARWSF